MDKVQKVRKNWFYSYNMIFEQDISEHAKLVYLYLCRCADSDGQSFPSHITIAKKCGIKSRQTIIAAIKELEQKGLLLKTVRIDKKGGQRTNLYVVQDTPCPSGGRPPVHLVDTPCPSDGHPPVHLVDTPCPSGGHEGLFSEGLPSEGLPSEGEATPTNQSTYGDYQKVKLAINDYQKLTAKYGKQKVDEYITQLDRRIASDGRMYANHMATLEIWIKKDEIKPEIKQNRFNNFSQRKRNYDEIEKMERKYLIDSIKNNEV